MNAQLIDQLAKQQNTSYNVVENKDGSVTLAFEPITSGPYYSAASGPRPLAFARQVIRDLIKLNGGRVPDRR